MTITTDRETEYRRRSMRRGYLLALLLFPGCASARETAKVEAEVISAAVPWIECGDDEFAVINGDEIMRGSGYTVRGCGQVERVFRICAGQVCAHRTLSEGLELVVEASGCRVEALGHNFQRPDTLYVGGCGDMWILAAQRTEWVVLEKTPLHEEFPLLWPDGAGNCTLRDKKIWEGKKARGEPHLERCRSRVEHSPTNPKTLVRR